MSYLEISPIVREILNCVAEERQADFCKPEKVDAVVLRRICLGLYKQAPLGAKGVRIKGAVITGTEFDLDWADVAVPLQFQDCTFEVPVKMVQARCKAIDFTGSTFEQGFDGDGMRADGDAFFINVTSTGPIELPGATISGRVVFTGATVTAFSDNGTRQNPGLAVSLANARVGNSVYLGDGHKKTCFTGVVNFSDVQVEGDLMIEDVTFSRDSEFKPDDAGALDMPGAIVSGNIFINKCTIKGGAALTGAQADMIFCNDNEIRACEGKKTYALDAEFLKLRGRLELKSTFYGNVNLSYAKIGGALTFDSRVHGQSTVDLENAVASSFRVQLVKWTESWNQGSGAKAKLDGFRFQSITDPDGNPLIIERDRCFIGINAKPHPLIKWLETNDGWNGNGHGRFRPQPYEHLATVLKKMGRATDANEILLHKTKEMFRQSVKDTSGLHKAYVRLKDLLLRLIGYGYRTEWVFGYCFLIILASSLSFQLAYSNGAMGIADPLVYLKDDHKFHAQEAINASWNPFTLQDYWNYWPPEEYTNFHPIIYSMDVFIPLVNLHQEEAWLPIAKGFLGYVAWIVLWLEVLAGWVLTSMIIASLTGLIKRD